MTNEFHIIAICAGILGFLSFVIMQTLIFRATSSKRVMRNLLYVFTFVELITVLVVSGQLAFMKHVSVGLLCTVMSYQFLIYGSLTYLYVGVFFGITVTSIRIHVLTLIVAAGQRGLSYSKISMLYNQEKLIEYRLERLVNSGYLSRKNNTYSVTTQYNIFMFHSYWQRYLRNLFRLHA